MACVCICLSLLDVPGRYSIVQKLSYGQKQYPADCEKDEWAFINLLIAAEAEVDFRLDDSEEKELFAAHKAGGEDGFHVALEDIIERHDIAAEHEFLRRVTGAIERQLTDTERSRISDALDLGGQQAAWNIVDDIMEKPARDDEREVEREAIRENHLQAEQAYKIDHENGNGFLDPRNLALDDLEEEPDTMDAESCIETPEPLIPAHVSKLERAFLPTGCCYDPRMKLHMNADYSGTSQHPEDPARIQSIFRTFRKAGLFYEDGAPNPDTTLDRGPFRYLWRIEAREATEAEICAAHEAEHYNWVASLDRMTAAELRDLTSSFDEGRKSLYVGSLTTMAAYVAAGSAIETCEAVVTGKVKNAFAIIRPPGHHAEHNESMGFCLFNNVAIAAKICQLKYPDLCRKVLILDWDVHHGNGVQNIFYEDPNVLYISIHVYQNGIFYPGASQDENIPDGGLANTGAGKGVGRNVNIGWVSQGVGDAEYMAAFQRIIMPIATEFNPDLVIISAGFDAAMGDELGGCFVTPECYSHMTHMLMSLANGKVAACLEGGYNLIAISRSALSVVKTLMGDPPEKMVIPPINLTSVDTLNTVKMIQSRYWECMRPGNFPAIDPNSGRRGERLTDVIRKANRMELFEKFYMCPVAILKTGVDAIFSNQVLATVNFVVSKKKLLVIHDPPAVFPGPDTEYRTFYPHNTIVSDTLLPYIQWAYNNGYGIMDVNFPQEGTNPQQHDRSIPDHAYYLPKIDENELQSQTRQLLTYLWDNYLEIDGRSSLSIIGVGDAFAGVKQLLLGRDTVFPRTAAILAFTDGILRPIKSETNPSLSSWYKDHTLIYVNPSHNAFSNDEHKSRLRKRRFGNVQMGEVEEGMDGAAVVARMMDKHLEDGTKFLREMREQWEEENVDAGDSTESEGDDQGVGGGGGRKAPVMGMFPAVARLGGVTAEDLEGDVEMR